MPSPTSPPEPEQPTAADPSETAARSAVKDRFDDLPARPARIGAHRAETPRLRVGVIVLWSVVATVAIVAAGVLSTLFATGRLDFNARSAPGSSSQVVAPQVDTSYEVLVLNATPDVALSDAVRQDVIAAGWAEADVQESNASSDDFATTTVYYGTTADEAAARGLADAIGGAEVSLDDTYQVVAPPETASAGGDPRSQLVVIVGLDFGSE